MASTDRRPDYDITITDGTNTVKANLCDNRGEFDQLNFRMSQQPRAALKIYQGGTEHSDQEPPYRSVEIRDFSGGIGNRVYDEQKTQYLYGKFVDTFIPERNILGPIVRYATGVRTEERYWIQELIDNDETELFPMQRVEVYNSVGVQKYFSHKFTVSEDITPTSIHFYLGYSQEEPWNSIPDYGGMRVAIYSDDGGEPDSQIFTSAAIASSGAYEYDKEVVFDFISPSQLDQGYTYHVVFIGTSTGAEPDNCPYLLMDGNGRSGYVHRSADGSSWYSYTGATPLFKLIEDDENCTVFFFEHLGAQYCIKSFDDFNTQGQDPQVWMNGDRGVATSGSSTTLVETSAGWTADEWIGAICVLFSGSGSQAKTRWREITDNTTDTLTVSPAWDIEPAAGTRYAIVNSNSCQEITGHGLKGQVTDVCVVGNIVYILQGDEADIVHMLDDTFELETSGFGGTYMTLAKDSYGDDYLWLVKTGYPPMIYKAAPVWVDPDGNLDIEDLDFVSNGSSPVTIADYGFETDLGNWVDVLTPTYSEQVQDGATGTPWGTGWFLGTFNTYQGEYSWGLQGDLNEGVEQAISVDMGSLYKVSAYLAASAGGIKMMAGTTQIGETVTRANYWHKVEGFFEAGSTSVDIEFLLTSNSSTAFIDLVKMDLIGNNLQEIGNERVTNIMPYGIDQRLHIITTGGIYMEQNGKFIRVSPKEYSNVKDDRNGVAAIQHGPYLFTSFMKGIGRYYDMDFRVLDYNPRINNLGIEVTDFASYGDILFAAVKGNSDDEDCSSAIIAYNGVGWNTLVVPPTYDKRISNLYIQTIPGEQVDRLWFNCGSDIAWVGIELNPLDNPNYMYAPGGVITIPQMYLEQRDIEKHWSRIKISARQNYNYEDIYSSMFMSYWYNIGSDYYKSNLLASGSDPIGENDDGIDSRFLPKINIVFNTCFLCHTPILDAFVVDLLEQMAAKWAYRFQIVLSDDKESLSGYQERTPVSTDITNLKSMVNSVTPVTVTSPNTWADNLRLELITADVVPVKVENSMLQNAVVMSIVGIEI